jgi:hypothetical protein
VLCKGLELLNDLWATGEGVGDFGDILTLRRFKLVAQHYGALVKKERITPIVQETLHYRD